MHFEFFFQRFGYRNPTYINLIRDPIQRLTSSFYYRLEGRYNYTVTKPLNNYTENAWRFMEVQRLPKNQVCFTSTNITILMTSAGCGYISECMIIVCQLCADLRRLHIKTPAAMSQNFRILCHHPFLLWTRSVLLVYNDFFDLSLELLAKLS